MFLLQEAVSIFISSNLRLVNGDKSSGDLLFVCRTVLQSHFRTSFFGVLILTLDEDATREKHHVSE